MEDRTTDFLGAALVASGWSAADAGPSPLPPELPVAMPRLTPAHPAPVLLPSFFAAAIALVRR